MAKNINSGEFPEETKLKLEIFSECFKAWLPVFINVNFVEKIFIFDFFAGSGSDSVGNHGSPLILLDIWKIYCELTDKENKEISFYFNEKKPAKVKELKNNIKNYIESCRLEKCHKQNCISRYKITQGEFKEIFNQPETVEIFNNKNYAKFVLLDQYGFKEVDKDIFLKLVHFPKTDFIFFISSSFIKRFKEHPYTMKYVETEKLNFNDTNPKECHRIIADYFEKQIPSNMEYYLHHFTINKGANYWGLIFGTHHTLGMKKFLSVCWKIDKLAGESNCNIDGDYQENELFYTARTNKINDMKNEIENKILNREIRDNITGIKFALKRRCLPKVFTEVVKDLEKKNKIKRISSSSYASSNIHKAEVYNIEVIKP